MPEPVTYPFTQERVEAQARLNVNVLILGSIAYAKAQGHSGHHWATFMGQVVAPNWAAHHTARGHHVGGAQLRLRMCLVQARVT